MPKAFTFTEYGGPENQEFADLPAPTPGPSELQVKVHAAGVNPVDVKAREGFFKGGVIREFPAVLGSEVSGVVTEVGSDVDGFAVGDEVLGVVAQGHGGFAEYSVLSAATTARKPTQVSFTDAAAVPVAAATAYDGVEALGLVEGNTLLINGVGGGVGVAAAQLARDNGVNVIGTGSESKRAMVESLGATLVTYGDGVADRVRALMPDGVDGIFDTVGGAALRAVASLATDKTKVISIADPGVADLGGSWLARTVTSERLQTVVDLVAAGKLDPHVTDVVAFDDTAQAIAAVESGHSAGKVVIAVAQP